MRATEPRPNADPPVVRMRRGRALALWLAVLVVVLALPVVALWSLMRSEAGTGWLLTRVPGLQIDGLRGALLGDRLSMQRLTWQGPAGRLDISALDLQGMRWTMWPAPGQWLALEADRVAAQRVQWRGAGTPASEPPSPPLALSLPVALTLPVQIDSLEVDDQPPVQDLGLTLRVGSDGGAAHVIEGLSLRWQTVRLSDGRLRLGTQAPLPLTAELTAASLDGAALPWQVTLQADGPLERLAVDAALRGPEGATADARGTLRPFAPWPLESLALQTEALDLSVLHPSAPRTRLAGRAELRRADAGAPLVVAVDLRNDMPGRWDLGLLPLARIETTVSGRLDAPDRIEIPRLALQLADAGGDAGRIDADGTWQAHTLTLATRLVDVAPHRLDRRASAMTLGGPLDVTLDGLPSPDPSAAGTPPPLALDLRTTLDGRLAGLPQAVRLAVAAKGSADAVTLERVDARAGDARATLTGRATRDGARWAVATEGRLVDFDPLPWWPGAQGTAWGRGPHRLNMRWRGDLGVPADLNPGPWPALLAGWTGDAEVHVERSQLAGMPLAGDAKLALAAEARGAELTANLTLAGNRVDAEARVDPRGQGRTDRWRVNVDAPALAALAPLASLHPAAAGWAPRGGTLNIDARATGRWPDLATEGTARARGVQSGRLSLAEADVDWRLDPVWPGATASARPPTAGGAATAPWGVRASVRDLRDRVGDETRTLTRLTATLEGSPAQHRLVIDASAPLAPNDRLTRSFGLPPASGTEVSLRANGAWQTETAPAGHRWRGRVERLEVDGLPTAPSSAPEAWLRVADLALALGLAPDGSLRSAQVEPNRIELAGGLRLRLDEARFEAATPTGRQQIQLAAELEAVPVAPFLARWQPEMGWAGDLRAGARIVWRVGDSVSADVVVERSGGDLQVRDIVGQPMALGLTDLRLALEARDGEWLFTQGLAGRALGELGGLVRLRTNPMAPYPGPDATLDGAVQARVADLGVWGAWVPPGWRLEGMLQTTARFGGRLGAPELQGSLQGSGLGVRNLLEGVHVKDGDVRVRLDGDRATVERFILKAGEGELRLTGGATLGANPVVTLEMVADRFQVLGRIDRRLVASGSASVLLDRERLRVTGNLGVDEGLFDISRADAPQLDNDVVVRHAGAPPPPPAPPDDRPQRVTDVDLRIALGEKLRLRGRGLDTRLAGDLRFSLPGGRPSLVGQVRTVSGTYAAYAQKLSIERGLVIFNGPPDTPRLDILALRPKLDVVVGVAITGPATSPRVRLYSEPDMSDSEKLSWLVLGRDPGSVDRADTALLQRAALALLSGEEPSPTDDLIRRFGLDDFSVRQGDDAAGEAIVSLGKQISDRWYVGYERSVNATAGTWQLIYRAAQRFTLRLQSGLDDAVDAIWVWRIE